MGQAVRPVERRLATASGRASSASNAFRSRSSASSGRTSSPWLSVAAVKAGDPLTNEEIEQLLDRRHLVEDSHHCPHGRPTALRITMTLHDPAGRLEAGREVQFIIDLPRKRK